MSQAGNAIQFEVPEELAALPPIPWALAYLGQALSGGASSLTSDADPFRIRLVRDEFPVEGFEIGRTASGLDISASEPRGFAYGLTELADIVATSDEPLAALAQAHVPSSAPAAPVRGVLRSFSSDVLDLAWFRDREFWTEYLDELAANRINRVQLALGMQYNYSHDADVRDNYLCFAYPFLLDVPGWERVHVQGVSEDDRRLNLASLRFASDEAARRGIHFQLGLWNHAVRPELEDSPHLRYPIGGLPDEQIAEYSTVALRRLLDECPAIAGVTFRVHYEGGVPEKGRGAFWRTVMSALKDLGRPLDVDMHSKGVDAELIEVARDVGAHVIISAKYWAEHQGLPYHQASVRPLENARPDNGDSLRGITQRARRFTRYGYGDFLGDDRDHDLLFRVWPGTQRFLTWADPELFAGYGRLSTIGGALGAELCEPLTFRGRKDSGRDGIPRSLYADTSLDLGRDDWKKYSYEYRLWGRLMYNPDADPETWLRALRAEFGPEAAEHLATALSYAGKVLPFVTVTLSLSASNNWYWPEVFTDMPIARHVRSVGTYDFDLAEPGTWGSVSPFDPQIFETTDSYADALVSGTPSGKITPDEVASRLLSFAEAAESAIAAAQAAARDVNDPAFRRLQSDVIVEALLGRFFAGKILAGIGYSIFRATGDAAPLSSALADYREGRDALARVVDVTNGVYANDLGFGDRPSEHGHWSDRLAQVDADIEELSREFDENRSESGREGTAATSRRVMAGRRDGLEHTPAPYFDHGQALTIVAKAPDAASVDLHFRHLNQGDDWKVIPMVPDGQEFTAAIEGEYTAARFPLEYFFVLRSADGSKAWLAPGLDDSLANQPYHVVPAHLVA